MPKVIPFQTPEQAAQAEADYQAALRDAVADAQGLLRQAAPSVERLRDLSRDLAQLLGVMWAEQRIVRAAGVAATQALGGYRSNVDTRAVLEGAGWPGGGWAASLPRGTSGESLAQSVSELLENGGLTDAYGFQVAMTGG